MRFVDGQNRAKPIPLLCVFLSHYDFHNKLNLLPRKIVLLIRLLNVSDVW